MDKEKRFDIKEIAGNFTFEGRFIEAEPYGYGHINDTFAARFKKEDGSGHRYILQRINHRVFKNPEKLMGNIEGITRHLREKILQTGGDPDRETLNLIPALDEKCFYKDPEGNYWRGYIFIEDAQTYQVVEKPLHFYHAGRAFGRFQKLLGDYPAETLYETIADFHHTPKRLEALKAAIERNTMNRAAGAKAELDFALARADYAPILVDLLKRGKLPLRVTHNDTKFNNVMIDNRTGEGICVIDLDTVMPGLSLYDFGDSIRFGTNPAPEDERDLSKVWMELGLFEQFARGFLEAAGGSFTKEEVEFMPFSAEIMTFECGIRFLTDYLNGDTYFKVHREGHNLDRARTQFKLLEDMERKFDKMAAIVNRYA